MAAHGGRATDPSGRPAERKLLDAVERALRGVARSGWTLLVLHLSRMPEPGPRPHHRRIAAALLDEVAERCTGQLFGLSDGDLALLFRPPDEGAAASALLGRLFEAEVADLATLRTLWALPAEAEAALRTIRGRVAEQADRAPQPGRVPPVVITDAGLLTSTLPQLATRQVAARLRPGGLPRIVPAFREVGVAPALLLGAAPDLGPEASDVLLPGLLTARMDRRVLDATLLNLGAGGPITGGLRTPLHLNLTLAGVMSEEFARFASALQAMAQAPVLGIEVSLDELVADPAAAILARERVRLAGMRFVLDQVGAPALLASRPEAFDPDWIKLAWSRPAPPDTPGAADRLAAAIERIGAGRIVMVGCESEAALVWALGRGIHHVQGSFVDAMLAAERLRACPAAPGCTMALCRDRAATLQPAQRTGCRNPGLLDAGTPGPP